MQKTRVARALDRQPSLPDTVTEVVHQNHIVGVEGSLGLARIGA